MTETSEYKIILTEERARLEDELRSVGQRNPNNPTEWEGAQPDTEMESDPNDQASLQDEYQENRAIVDVLNTRYQEVLAALDRINAGTYGVCTENGEEIEEDRLKADPAAATCKAHM